MSSRRVICIVGISFCGSTLLSRLLATLDDVAAAGELHWMYDAPAVGGVETRAGWKVKRQCVCCGADCSVFTRKFVLELPPRRMLYQCVAERLGVGTLVVSDKMPGTYEVYCEAGSADGIVMFKRPEAAVLSMMVNERSGVREAVNMYANAYEHMSRWAEKFFATALFVSYEDVAIDPFGMVSKLKRELGIPGHPPGASAFADGDYHAFGGNPKAHSRTEILLDSRWVDQLTDDQKSEIRGYRKAMSVYRELMERRVR